MADLSIDQFNENLSKAITKMGESLPKVIDARALNAIALLKDRIIQRGNNVDESGNETSFPAYSENEIPLFFYKNGKLMAPFSGGTTKVEKKVSKQIRKKLTKKEKALAKEIEAETGEKATQTMSYKRWRELNGRQTNHVDLAFTGDMLRKLKIVNRQRSGTTYTASVGGGDEFSQKKIEYNSDHYGDIMNLSTKEIETISEAAKEDLLEIFNRALG